MAYPLFRKRHFEILADALRERGGTLNASDIADLMEQQNKLFNRQKFMEAATHVKIEYAQLELR